MPAMHDDAEDHTDLFTLVEALQREGVAVGVSDLALYDCQRGALRAMPLAPTVAAAAAWAERFAVPAVAKAAAALPAREPCAAAPRCCAAPPQRSPYSFVAACTAAFCTRVDKSCLALQGHGDVLLQAWPELRAAVLRHRREHAE